MPCAAGFSPGLMVTILGVRGAGRCTGAALLLHHAPSQNACRQAHEHGAPPALPPPRDIAAALGGPLPGVGVGRGRPGKGQRRWAWAGAEAVACAGGGSGSWRGSVWVGHQLLRPRPSRPCASSQTSGLRFVTGPSRPRVQFYCARDHCKAALATLRYVPWFLRSGGGGGPRSGSATPPPPPPPRPGNTC